MNMLVIDLDESCSIGGDICKFTNRDGLKMFQCLVLVKPIRIRPTHQLTGQEHTSGELDGLNMPV